MAEPCRMPFCKGCGHAHVLRRLDEALVTLGLDPSAVCLVSDIGCIGLADALFPLPHTVHTTHGRSTGFAAGIELADSALGDSRLKTVVLIGDGGAMIGLLHLVNAALLNLDVTVLLCNNYLFGMTGGQNSAFSPLGFVTATTPQGNSTPPLDVCTVMAGCGAEFVARELATDPDLGSTIAGAIAHPGFAVVEIVELCTEFGVKKNPLSGAGLRDIVERHGQQMGRIRGGRTREEFGSMYRSRFPATSTPAADPAAAASAAPAGGPDGFIVKKHPNALTKKFGIVIAGSAGERVQSAAGMLCEAAALCGLHSTQKNDNPVTQGSGFSLAEVCLSPGPIGFTGIDAPDAVIAVSEEGARELASRGAFAACRPGTIVIHDEQVVRPPSAGEIIPLPLRKTVTPQRAALAAIAALIRKTGIFPLGALEEAFGRDPKAAAALVTSIPA